MLRTQTLTTRIRFVWFDMEERGLIGSAQYVAAHANEPLLAMINFDINAYGDTVLFGPAVRADNAALRRELRRTCAAQDLQCVGFAQMPPGDDRSFVKAGVPTVSVAMLPEIEVQQMWLMMNGGATSRLAQASTPAILETIHTPEDTPEKVNGEAMTRMLHFASALVHAVAHR
jgi:Zn-dependent M28 family amino/carboxypeptidase